MGPIGDEAVKTVLLIGAVIGFGIAALIALGLWLTWNISISITWGG